MTKFNQPEKNIFGEIDIISSDKISKSPIRNIPKLDMKLLGLSGLSKLTDGTLPSIKPKPNKVSLENNELPYSYIEDISGLGGLDTSQNLFDQNSFSKFDWKSRLEASQNYISIKGGVQDFSKQDHSQISLLDPGNSHNLINSDPNSISLRRSFSDEKSVTNRHYKIGQVRPNDESDIDLLQMDESIESGIAGGSTSRLAKLEVPFRGMESQSSIAKERNLLIKEIESNSDTELVIEGVTPLDMKGDPDRKHLNNNFKRNNKENKGHDIVKDNLKSGKKPFVLTDKTQQFSNSAAKRDTLRKSNKPDKKEKQIIKKNKIKNLMIEIDSRDFGTDLDSLETPPSGLGKSSNLMSRGSDLMSGCKKLDTMKRLFNQNSLHTHDENDIQYFYLPNFFDSNYLILLFYII